MTRDQIEKKRIWKDDNMDGNMTRLGYPSVGFYQPFGIFELPHVISVSPQLFLGPGYLVDYLRTSYCSLI